MEDYVNNLIISPIYQPIRDIDKQGVKIGEPGGI